MSETKETPSPGLAGGAAAPLPAELLRSVIDATDVYVFVKDRAGRYLFANRAATEAVGRTLEEIAGHDDAHFFPAGIAREIREHDEAVMASGQTLVVEETLELGAEQRVFLATKSPLRSPSGEVIGIVGLSREITARKRAEAGLRLSEARFHRLVDSSPIGLVFGSGKSDDLSANDAFLRMLGYTQEDLETGRLVHTAIVAPEDAAADARANEQLLRTGACTPYEKQYLRKDGSRVPALVAVTMIQPERQEWVAFVVDLSERSQLTQRLQRQIVEFETLLSVFPIGIGIARDPACRRIAHNRYSARLLKLPADQNGSLSAPEEERPTGYRFVRDGRELPAEALPIQRAAAEGREVLDWEAELRVDGEAPRALLAHAAPLFDEAGRPRGAIGAFLDITERKRAEAAQQLLAHAGEVLAGTLDFERTLQGVAEVAVPRFADWCFVDLADDEGGMRRVAHAFANPAHAELAALLARFPTGMGAASPSARVRASGRSLLLNEFPPELFAALARSEEHERALREVNAVSVIVAPLVARGRGLGAVTFINGESGRRYGPDDVAFAEELARRAALAVDNAGLYRAAQQSARRAEEARALVDTLLASAPVGFALLDPELRYVRVNDALGATLRLSPAQMIGRTPREILPDLADALESRYRYVLERGEPIVSREISGEVPASPGELRSWISSYYPVRTADGRIIGIGALIADITERKRAEENERFLGQATALLASSLDYEATLTQLATLAVPRLGDWCVVDMLDGDVLRRMGAAHRDPAKREVLQAVAQHYPLHLQRSRALQHMITTGRPLFLPELTDEDLAASASNEEHLRLLHEVGTRSGLSVPLTVRGRLVGLLSVGRSEPGRLDETDLALAQELARRTATAMENARLHREAERARAAAEAAARRSAFLAEAGELLASSLDMEQTLQSLVRLTVPALADLCLVLLADEEGTLRRVAEAVPNARVAELMARLRALPAYGRSSNPLRQVFTQGKLLHIQDYLAYITAEVPEDREYLELIREVGFAESVFAPLQARGRTLGVLTLTRLDPTRRYAPEDVGLITDLARRVAQAVENNRLYRDAQLAVRIRDDFLSIASHELRTPLAALQLQVVGVLRAAEKGEELLASRWVASRAAKAAANVERLAGLVDKLLDVSRLTSGHMELHLEPVDLSALVGEVTERFMDQLDRSRLSLRMAAGVVGQWDRFRLEQVVTNLLANAIKYGQGKPIEIEVVSAGDAARLRVTDHGIGISSEGLGRLFGRFERAVPTRQYGGFGLGLWIAKQIVEALGGRIAVESQPDQGSTFTVELPMTGARGR